MKKLYCISFVLLLSVGLSDPPDWSVSPPDFQFNASMNGVLIFNGEESTDSNDIIAAFVGDECRGVKTDGIIFSGRMVFGLTIFGNENGESLTFKSYDASNDQVNDNIDFTYSFVPNDNVGSMEDPIEWDFILSVEYEPLPDNFVLYPAYPNPFNPVLNIPLALVKPGELSVSVVDVNGRIVDTISNSFWEPGMHTLTWNGGQFSSGVYFISVNYNGGVIGQKVLLLK
jgi:hypothetical protein